MSNERDKKSWMWMEQGKKLGGWKKKEKEAAEKIAVVKLLTRLGEAPSKNVAAGCKA